MCSLRPFYLNLHAGQTHKINGHVVSGYRVQYTSTRGFSFFYHGCKFGCGRSLIAQCVHHEFNGDYCFALIARAMAIFDTIQYLVFGPLSLLLNVIMFLAFFVAGIVTLFGWFCMDTLKFKGLQTFLWLGVLTLPITWLINIAGFIMVPLQIVLPELTTLMRWHTWDTACNEEENML